MKPMMRWTGDLQSRREFDAFYAWAQRGGFWVVVTGGGFVVVGLLLWGPGSLPESVHIPWWLGGSIVSFIVVPGFCMMGVAFVHLVKADRARRREARDGQVVYTHSVARWIDTHGLLVGLIVVVLVVIASTLWALHHSRCLACII